MDVLIDTSAVMALALPRDQWHVRARAFLRSPGLRVHTTSVVLGESYTFLRQRAGYEAARLTARGLVDGHTSTVHQVDLAFDAAIWTAIDEFAGVPLSYQDASLIVLGRRLRIRQAFSFDEDLRAAGLELVPESTAAG